MEYLKHFGHEHTKKYHHNWVTLSDKYDQQRPPKVSKPNGRIKPANGGENSTNMMDSTSMHRFSRPKKAQLPPPVEGTYEARQLRECTFSPKVNGKKKCMPSNRTLDQFLKS